MNSDHIGRSFQRRPIDRSRDEASSSASRPLSFSPPVNDYGRRPQSRGHPTSEVRCTSKERLSSKGTKDTSRHRSASTGRPISRGRSASNGRPRSSIRPTSKGRPASNLRPIMKSGGGRSRSRGRDRSPPHARADSNQLLVQRRSMSDSRALEVTVSSKYNWQSIIHGCPPPKRKPDSNLRPMNDGKSCSRSRGQDRCPLAYEESKALLLRRRSMSDTGALEARRRMVSFSPPKRSGRSTTNGGKGRSCSQGRARTPPANAGSQALVARRRMPPPPDEAFKVGPNPHRALRRRRWHLHSRQPSWMEHELVVYMPDRGRQRDSFIPIRPPSRNHRQLTDSTVPPSRRRSPQTEAATRSPSRSRSIAPGEDDLHKNSKHEAPYARSDMSERSSSRSTTRQQRDDSLERIMSTMRRTLSIDSFEEEPSRKRENSIDGRLPKWSDVNAHTRSKTEDLSTPSRQVPSTPRRISSTRPRSPSSGRRIPTPMNRQQRGKSLERMEPESLRRNVTLDSLCDDLDASQANSLSMRSHKTSASSKIFSNPPSALKLKRSPSDDSLKYQGKIIHGNRRANEANKDVCAFLLEVIKENQGKKLRRVNSAEEAQSRSKPRNSSIKALLPISDDTPSLGKKSPSGPGVRGMSFDERLPSASSTLNGHNASSNNISGSSSFNDIGPSVSDFPGEVKQDSSVPRVNSAEDMQSFNDRQMRTYANVNGLNFSSAPKQPPSPPPPRKQSPPPPPRPRTIDAALNKQIGSSAITQSQLLSQEAKNLPQRSLQQRESMMDVQQQPDYQHQEAPVVGKSKEWMKYTTQTSRQETTEDGNSNGKTRKLFGRESRKKSGKNEQIKSCNVKQMPFTDQFGDFGYYTGQVDDEGRPNGKGVMKYENGVFYEGTWINGCQDKDAASQYERIRGGFTSWSGKGKGGTKSGTTLPWNSRKNDAFDGREKTNVRGLDWTDLNGYSGRYTGEVDNDQLPHGPGIMRYDYGLIAEGEWVHGVLKEGPYDRMISAVAMNGGQSVAPGMLINSGMSVGPGAIGYAGGAISVLGAGGMSVCPPVGFGRGMAPPVANPMQFREMNASQHALLAHQNAMMKMNGGADGGGVYGGGGSVYHGGNGSVYVGNGMVMPMQQMPTMPIQPMQHVAMQQPFAMQQQQPENHQPPISNIIIK
ncbi:hypothetical protein ACHAXA_001756 [Cyclostephanos tholiformis]|uniref:Uncharacterized protein n=1 Tax=Cyclostephanos tholiformis TaxID=382380 RepID=A0ABD3RYD7_9STRA